MADINETISDATTDWHSGFCAAAELGLSENKEDLFFEREYPLSKRPLRIDMLIVEKRDGVQIKNKIGHIFKRYNIIEYKSPGDGLSIDDFFKTYSYAGLYKSLGETEDARQAEQITVSMFRNEKPEKMIEYLKEHGLTIEEKYPNIYYVGGLLFSLQIVVTRQIEGKKNRGLRILSRNASEEDILAFIEEAGEYTTQGDKENVDAILQVSVSANYELYEELKRREPNMCEAMRRLMKDEIADEVREAQKDGEMKARRETAFELADMGLPVEKIAKAVKVSLETVQKWLSGNVGVAK